MQANFPDKQVVRQHMQDRSKSKEPPPTPERTLEILDWKMVAGERDTKLQQR